MIEGATNLKLARPRPEELLGHSTICVALGLMLVLFLLFSNGHPVLDMIVNSAAPELTMAVLVAVFTLPFGVGATLTGLLFILTED
jgi:hypothetical protein